MNFIQISSIIVIVFSLNIIWDRFFVYHHNKSVTADSISIEHKHSKKIFSLSAKVFFTSIVLIPLIGGLWAINYWFKEYNLSRDSLTWEKYPGVILSKRVSYFKPVGQTSTQISGKTYVPEVEYEFTYNNKVIKWDVIDFKNAPASGDISKSEKVLASLPDVGEKVDVYFSPKYAKAVLFPGTKNSNYFGVVIGSMFFAIGLVALKYIYTH